LEIRDQISAWGGEKESPLDRIKENDVALPLFLPGTRRKERDWEARGGRERKRVVELRKRRKVHVTLNSAIASARERKRVKRDFRRGEGRRKGRKRGKARQKRMKGGRVRE